MFSDKDIEKALDDYQKNPQDGLLIEPFDKSSLTPVGYDLRVGKQGFSWNKKSVIEIERDGKIQIDANDTVVIRTLESISLSKKVSATVHSIVSKIITKGLSDISTTIDPGWTGKLLISIHNNRNSSTELRFEERLCTVCFYRVDLASEANRDTSNNREELWEQLLGIARAEKERIEKEKNKEQQGIEKANEFRTFLLIVLGVVALIVGIGASIINPTIGASIAAFLAVIAPIVYDRFLKPISK
ncbi:dCTP deaminase domain-containing protein [Argonema galeatum]|uniref:dCTP deaminase domain-containing protein n=1 Tax=Argonema galeatum TaxID=2942762 RepID=UPI00201250B0|nr:deoxycytidine deaminase [Argonema galeatum]MCL1467752.1 deoxycytidine deaminase [Argonema galeatum A003/A1]